MRDKEEFSRGDPDAAGGLFWLSALNWIVPALVLAIGIFAATQKFAAFMNCDEKVVGRPLLAFKNGTALYNPLVFLMGMFKYAFNDAYSYYFFKAAPPAFIALAAAFMLFVFTGILAGAHQRNQHIHGTARWATKKDLKSYGMLQRRGVVCGELASAGVGYHVGREKASLTLDLKKRPITRRAMTAPLVCHSGRTNTWMIAPTRSGKGVSTVIPTCLNYGVPYYARDKKTKKKTVKGRGSMVIFDPKGENWEATAGWRSKFSVCIPFRPLGDRPLNGKDREAPKWKKMKPEETAHYNPIHEIPDNPNSAFAWADMIAEIFFGGEKKGGGGNDASEYFANKARDIFTAVVLHVRFAPESEIPWKKKNMSTVLAFMSDASDGGRLGEGADDEENNGCGEAMCRAMIECDHGSETVNGIIRLAANRSLLQPAKERGSTYSTVFSKISLFQDPLIAEATSYSDFSVDDFINAENGISLYLIVPYNHIQRIAPVFRMLITFMIKKFSDGTTNATSVKLKIPCLFLLDEFPVLGYFPDIALNAGILAGYGVTFFIVSQSLNQIVDVYGENHPFLDHCKTIILYAPGNLKDARQFAETIGNRSVLLDTVSSSGSKWEAGFSNVSRGSQEMQTSLINPDELMKLEFNRAIIFNQGMPPYKGKKVVYYEDPRFKDKAWLAVPEMKFLLRRMRALPSNKKSPAGKTIEKKIEGMAAVDVSQVIAADYLFSA